MEKTRKKNGRRCRRTIKKMKGCRRRSTIKKMKGLSRRRTMKGGEGWWERRKRLQKEEKDKAANAKLEEEENNRRIEEEEKRIAAEERRIAAEEKRRATEEKEKENFEKYKEENRKEIDELWNKYKEDIKSERLKELINTEDEIKINGWKNFENDRRNTTEFKKMQYYEGLWYNDMTDENNDTFCFDRVIPGDNEEWERETKCISRDDFIKELLKPKVEEEVSSFNKKVEYSDPNISKKPNVDAYTKRWDEHMRGVTAKQKWVTEAIKKAKY